MAEHGTAPTRRGDTSPWVDASTRTALELIAAGVTELVGFDVAAISVVLADELEVVAVSGNDSARDALQGSRTQIPLTVQLLDLADDWGVLRFIPHERAADYLSRHGWTPDYEPLGVEGAWDPRDMLFAPFFDAGGGIQGILAVDLPSDGMRPGPLKRRQLEKYAVQAGRAILTALERARLAEQLDLVSRTRVAIREASRELSLDGLLERCQEELVEGFRASGMWIHTIEDRHVEHGVLLTGSSFAVADLPALYLQLVEEGARRAWDAGRVDIVSPHRIEGTELSPSEVNDALQLMGDIGVHSALFVPLGEGRTCLGSLVLTRGVRDPDWSDVEISVALDVGIDLGHAISHARAFEREQALVRELQALDTYKTELIATLSHELKTPLSSILVNLELLASTHVVSDDGRRGVSAIERGTHRLVRVVDDLMLLAKVGDPANPLVKRSVDLGALVDDVLAMTAGTVEKRSLTVDFVCRSGPVLAAGDPGELDRVITNIVGNATKYTHEGGRISITVESTGSDAVLTCTDDGMGISESDQTRLFHEFFRSTNPHALRLPGTGLGLAIVERIVERHGGRIAVHSTLGAGTTFVVTLPAPPPDSTGGAALQTGSHLRAPAPSAHSVPADIPG